MGPASPPADPPWPLTLGSDVDALAINGDRLYVGVGRSVVAYDISVPGAARRLSRSAYVGGRVARLAVGGDRLFAVVRPDDFHPTMDPRRAGSPPWTTLAVMDLSQPDAPLLTANVGLWNESHNLFAGDLAARGRMAYLAVFDSFLGDVVCGGDGDTKCGLMIIDASLEIPKLTLRDDLSPGVYRLLVRKDTLLALGYLPRKDTESRPDFHMGFMTFGLANAATPRLISAPGQQSLRYRYRAWNLSVMGDRVFHVLDQDALLTASLADNGELRLLLPQTTDPAHAFDLLPRLALRQPGRVYRTATQDNRLHLLLLEDPLRIVSLDVTDPMHPTPFGELALANINFSQRPMRFGSMWDDTWGDLVATQDARLFVAGGDSGLLVEVDVSQAGALRELARYAAVAAP